MRSGLVLFVVAACYGSAAAETAVEIAVEGSSIACGAPNRGALANAARLPASGYGYVIPPAWRERNRSFGSDRLVGLIERVSTRIADLYPDSVLGVGDLSDEFGGAIPDHSSHQSGRDVDLIYYALDESGDPVEPSDFMPYYDRTGRATRARAPVRRKEIPTRYFDRDRNWALVRALATDEEVDVTRIFVARPVRRWLLEHARDIGETEEVILEMRRLMRSPSDHRAHRDHMHVRISCSFRDRELGRCRDEPVRPRLSGRKWRWRVRCPVDAPRRRSR